MHLLCLVAEAAEARMEAMIVPTGTPISGSHGNPYYAAEIQGKGKFSIQHIRCLNVQKLQGQLDVLGFQNAFPNLSYKVKYHVVIFKNIF